MRTRIGTMLRGVLSVSMVLAVAAIALAADINGKWKGELEAPDGSKA